MLTLFLTLPPHLFQPCSGSSFPPSTWAYLISPPPGFTRQHRLSISLHSLLFPSLSPGHRATVYLDGAPACRPPLLVCAHLPCGADQRSSSREQCLPSLFRFPSLAVLNKFPGPCCPQGYPDQVSFSPSACPHQPHTRPHPLLASTGGPVPCRPQVVTPCYYSLVPCASALPSLIYFAPSLDIF